MRRFHIYIGFIVWLLTSLFAVSCTDELEGNGYTPNSSSNLHVLVPTVLCESSGSSSEVPTYNATVDECQINDLRLYAFPVNNNGKLVAENLPAPLASMMLEENVANYQLTIEPGTYHIYVVANMSDVLKDQNITTEGELKKLVLGYTSNLTPGLPISTNIPMIYEPKEINGKTAETEIKATDKSATVIANLKFTCVKVKLNLIFDPAVATAFSGKSFSIKNIIAQQLSPSTSLCWDGKFSQSQVSDDYKKGFESKEYEANSTSNSNGLYYPSDAWTRNNENATVNDKDVITLNEGVKGSANPTDATAKWLFQGTYYLPERYIADASQQSRLAIEGSIDGNIDNKYIIPLGHKQNESSTTELPTFPRGTYYEIIGNIQSLGNATLDCNVSVKDWTPVTIDADFNHTKLWVSKTEANVTSMKNDYITYNSNAAIKFGCDKQINSNDIIICKERGKDANGNDSIEFRVNPDIPISAYAEKERKGTAKVWLQANNLKKYIDVNYDVTPYLDVTKELVIYYNKDESQNSRNIEWDTNLGGIKLEKTELTKGNSTIKMTLNPSDAVKATGVFTVTATSDPITTTIHEFKVIPQNETTDVKYKTVRVIVRPPVGDYRICFRAINDLSIYNGKEVDFMAIKEEGGTNNWYDGWDNNGGANSPKEDNHRIYVYTQIGETKIESGNLPNKGKWIYTYGDTDKDNWPGETMTADKTNTGWYYKDFKVGMVQIRKKDTEEDRKIKPGETLIMFNNNKDTGVGYTLHRCPHHREPGIPLFDYEDHEGWIVYDPTSDPEYHIFDDMPEIVNLNITIYTEKKTMGWYRKYGIAGNSTTDQFKIKDEIDNENVDHGNSWKREKKGNWWKTVITLKAIKGEHNKDIKIKQKDGDELTLFNGNSFKDDTGYYQNGKWYQGKPNGVTE